MRPELIFIPILLQIFLVIFLYVLLAQRKKKAISLSEVDEEKRALYADAWPEYVIKINNAIRNQFEVPVLFYVLSFIIWAQGLVNVVTLLIASCFVISRYIHAFIHVGSNTVPRRRNVFVAGVALVLLLTVIVSYYIVEGLV